MAKISTWWVVHMPTNRIGQVLETTKRKALVQFGSGGPFENVWQRELRQATGDEIAEKEGT